VSCTTSIVTTASASRYLQQLCKHWSHKFPAEFDANHGTVALPAARLTLAADETRLVLTLDAPEPADLPRLGEVVADHLRRFAFREDLAIDWTASA
jgi:uncharacterized protein